VLDAFVLLGVVGGFVVVMASALWLIGTLTGGSGDDDHDTDRMDH
jgi:hypothetical protein